MAFSIMRENFIQILHDGCGHWITLSAVGAQASNKLFIYDTMLHSSGGHGRKEVGQLSLVACPRKGLASKYM